MAKAFKKRTGVQATAPSPAKRFSKANPKEKRIETPPKVSQKPEGCLLFGGPTNISIPEIILAKEFNPHLHKSASVQMSTGGSEAAEHYSIRNRPNYLKKIIDKNSKIKANHLNFKLADFAKAHKEAEICFDDVRMNRLIIDLLIEKFE